MPDTVSSRSAREARNWRVHGCGPTLAIVVEPGGDHEWRFEGMEHPYDAAIAFAAARLRGDRLP